MKVFIQNKFFSLGGSSTVKDENEKDVFRVKGKLFSPTKKKKIYDMNGNLLYVVRNKFFNFFHWFTDKAFIIQNKEKIATVKFGLNNAGSYIVENYKDEIHTEGKFFSTHTNILRNGEIMATIDRNKVTFTDYFALDANEEDIPFLIAFIIAIDNIKDRK